MYKDFFLFETKIKTTKKQKTTKEKKSEKTENEKRFFKRLHIRMTSDF